MTLDGEEVGDSASRHWCRFSLQTIIMFDTLAPSPPPTAAPVLLDCQVHCASGDLSLRSSSKLSRSQATLHFRARAGSIAAVDVWEGTGPSTAAAELPNKAAAADETASSCTEAEQYAAALTPQAAASINARVLAALADITNVHQGQHRELPGVRCTAEVSLALQSRGVGWVAHPGEAEMCSFLVPWDHEYGLQRRKPNCTKVMR